MSRTANFSNSFISDKLTVTGSPVCCSPENSHAWADYNTDDWDSDSIIACVQDRVKAYGYLDLEDIATCFEAAESTLDFKAYPVGYFNPGAYALKKIIVQIREVTEDYPTTESNTYAIYDEKTATREVGTGTWTSDSENLIITESTGRIDYSYEFRCRWEDDILPIDVRTATQAEPLAESSVSPSLIESYSTTNGYSQDWVEKTLEVVWRVEFSYPDISFPFTHVYVYRQRVYVHDYDDSYIYPIISDIKIFDPDGAEIDEVCSDLEYVVIRVDLTNPLPVWACDDNFNLIAHLDRQVYGINNILEEESYAGQLTQMTADEIYDVDITVGAVDLRGYFRLDVSLLPEGIYKVCGVVKATNYESVM